MKPSSPEQKTCKRCGDAFFCYVADIAKCQCYGISLTDDIRKYIAANYNDCVCRKCLQEIELKNAR